MLTYAAPLSDTSWMCINFLVFKRRPDSQVFIFKNQKNLMLFLYYFDLEETATFQGLNNPKNIDISRMIHNQRISSPASKIYLFLKKQELNINCTIAGIKPVKWFKEGFLMKKFNLGHLVITPEASKKLTLQDIAVFLKRHQYGDRGEISEGDRPESDVAPEEEGKLYSSHNSTEGIRFGVITEADRGITTIFLVEKWNK